MSNSPSLIQPSSNLTVLESGYGLVHVGDVLFEDLLPTGKLSFTRFRCSKDACYSCIG